MFSYHIQELTGAIEQLESLRKSLDYIRATTARSELAETVRDFQGKAAALREELENSIAAHLGDRLTDIAEEMEAGEIARGEIHEDIIFSLGELRRMAKENEPLVLDRDLRILQKAWEESFLPEDFLRRSTEARLVSGFGSQAATVLAKYYEEIKGRAE